MVAEYGVRTVSGQVIATGISAEDYMERYASEFCEWIEGTVIKMSPASLRHDELIYYLRSLLEAYFVLRPIGRVLGAPFVMRSHPSLPRREPDLQVILKSNPGTLTDTFMNGPADICIEIVSPDSVGRDYEEKLLEYQKGGVREYWIIDPLKTDKRFYRLNEAGVYARYQEDASGYYRSPLLLDFGLHVTTLWQPKLPDLLMVVQTVQAMLTK